MSNEQIQPNELTSSRKEVNHNDHKRFTSRILRLNALACNNFKNKDFDIEEAVEESKIDFKALNPKGGLQEMLAAQMLSVHRLQQISMALAIEANVMDTKQYFINAAVKLANCFNQQATLLTKLQGGGGQKIVVEHVEVHHGGQALVGNVNGITPTNEVKK